MSNKIRGLEELSNILDKHRAEQKRIVHCHGVFDLLHIGHIRHFEESKKMGDILVVTVTPDRYVNKGIGRPAFGQTLRAEFIAALQCVDYVAVNLWPTAIDTIYRLRPHIFVKGSEFRDLKDTIGHVSKESDAVRAVGGEIAFTDDITFSSSALINQYMSQFPEPVREYLNDFSRRCSAAEVLKPLRETESLKVLVIGETIIDEYAYCEAMGKSGKEPVLASRALDREQHGGGVIACANHAASFCEQVDVLTYLGEGHDQEDFVRSCCKGNVNPLFVYKERSPTIVKKRYIEKYLGQKMFELYTMNDEPFSETADLQFRTRLHDILPQYDVVIVADYGHGLLSQASIQLLAQEARFLSVNTQSNAGNHGFNLISKYPRADYICLAQREYALDTRNQRLSPEAMVRLVAERTHSPRAMMTQGKFGSFMYNAPDQFKHVPALATQVVDRVGAGDAVLCVTSLLASVDAPAETMAFLGNVVGAEAVTIMGNKSSIERIPLYRHVECLLKVHQNDQPDTLKMAG